MTICKLCHERPATVPDRDGPPASRRLTVCSTCHRKRLVGDLENVAAQFRVEMRKRGLQR